MHPGPRVALAVAASSGLYAAGVLFPPLLTPVALVAPLPGLLLATRSPRTEYLWLLLSLVFISVGLGTPAVLGFALSFGVPTVILVAALRRGWSFERTVLAGMAFWSAGILALCMAAYGDLTSISEAVRQQLDEAVQAAIAASESGGMSASASALAEQREEVIAAVVQIVPALVILAGGFVVLINLALLRSWTGQTNEPDLRRWAAPDGLIWVLIASGFTMFAPLSSVATVARNLFVVLLGGYFCQGLAIVSFYLHRFRLPLGLRVATYLFVAVQQMATLAVLALGIFDLWGDFRRLRRQDPDASPETEYE